MKTRLILGNLILGLQWAFATTAGWVVGFLAGQIVGNLVEGFINESPPLIIGITTEGLIIGLFIGVAQWFVIRGQLRFANWWIITTIISWTISALGTELMIFVINLTLPRFMNPALNIGLRMTFLGVVTGILSGILQWPIMRSQVRYAMSWILSNIIGWSSSCMLMGISMGYLTFRDGSHLNDIANAFALLAFIGVGAVAGGITGISLWLSLQYLVTSQIPKEHSLANNAQFTSAG